VLGPLPAPRPPTTARALAAAAGLYAILAVIATWPLLLHFQDHVPGSELWRSRTIHNESLLNLWNLWWFRHALLDLRQDPFDCGFLLHPYGVNLWFHTLSPFHGLIGIVLQTFGSLAAAQNALLLLDLIAAGVCTFALALRLGLGRTGARVAGAIYAFSPIVFAHLYAGHYDLVGTFWMPAILLAWLNLLDAPAPRARQGVTLGLLFVGAAYSAQYYFVYGAELLAAAALCRLGAVRRPAALRALAVTALVAAIGVAPLLWNFLGAAGMRPDESSSLRADFDRFSGDAIGFAVPSFTHPILSRPLYALYDQLGAARSLPQETTTYIGLCVLLLSALGVVVRRRERQPVGLLLAISLVFAVLSLGSHLKVVGIQTGIPLPGLLLTEIPILRLARAPGRHVVVAMLGFAVLAGAGWERLGPRWLRGGVLGLLAFEYAALPLPLLSTQVAPVYHRLAEVAGDFAVLEVPFGVQDGRGALGWPDNGQIFAQSVHGRPIVAANVSRLPREMWPVMLSTPVIGTLLDPGSATPETRRRDRAEGRAFFARSKLDAVVVHPTPLGRQLQAIVQDSLTIRRREKFADGSELLWVNGP
jgi:hypothetical protein